LNLRALARALVFVVCIGGLLSPSGFAAEQDPADRPLYYERPIVAADLEGRTLRELNLMRNWIYARAGNVFRKQWLHDFFKEKPWYQPTGLDEKKLSDLDKDNAVIIARYEGSLSREDLTRRKEEIPARYEYTIDQAPAFLLLSGDGTRVATIRTDCTIWEFPTGKRVSSFAFRNQAVPIAAEFLDDGRQLAVAWRAGNVEIWDVGSQTLAKTASVSLADGAAFESIAGSGTIVAVTRDGEATFVDLTSGAIRRRQRLPGGEVHAMGISPNGRNLIFSYRRKPEPKGVYLADLTSTGAPTTIDGDFHSADRIVFSRDSNHVVASDLHGNVSVWALEGDKKSGEFTIDAYAISDPHGLRDLDLSTHGEFVVGIPKSGDVVRWDVGANSPRWTTTESSPAKKVVISPDGKMVLTALDKGGLVLRDAETRAPIPTWKGHAPWSPEDKIEMVLLGRALGEPIRDAQELADRTPLDDPKLLDELVTVDQLKDMSRRDLRILRNMIYARRGRPFKSPLLGGYFKRMEWYKADPTYTDARLTPLDKKNIKIVRSVEDQLGGPLTDKEQGEEFMSAA
jgi:dipeptidyl aminopeptidase/acylaminoacyl peptidase